MWSATVTMAVFTGTGNTLAMARVLAEKLERAGRRVTLVPMERENFSLPEKSALGLAVPVACFSTYPTVHRFIDALPEGRGREAFFLATMGGFSGGMEGPVRKTLERKGYRPAGAKIVVMPSNYGNKTIPVEGNKKRVAAATEAVAQYAQDLLAGRAAWGRGNPLASFMSWLGHTRKPWRAFYRFAPLTVDASRCTGCGICRDLCPEKNISMENDTARIGDRCESCQRCCGFCPEEAISVPGKPAERYRAFPLDQLLR